jgi:YbbR domain-containing protein
MAWPKPITHNLGWKVISVVLAALIWLALDSGLPDRFKPVDQRAFSQLPIVVMTAAKDERVFQVAPRAAEVTLSGEREVLANLRARDIQVFVNLTDPADAAGRRKRVQVHTPPGVTLVQVTPEDVIIHTEAVQPPTPKVGN